MLFVILPTRPFIIFDAKGIRDANLLEEEYSLHPEVMTSIMTEKELIDLVHKPGDPLYKTYTFEELEGFILKAQTFINKYYENIFNY